MLVPVQGLFLAGHGLVLPGYPGDRSVCMRAWLLCCGLLLTTGCGYYIGATAVGPYGYWSYHSAVVTYVDAVQTDIVYRGDVVDCRLQIRNDSDRDDVYRYGAGHPARFWVLDADGRTIWDSTLHEAPVFGQVSVVIAAYSSLWLSAVWDLRNNSGQSVPAGRYRVYAQALGSLDSGVPLSVVGPVSVDVVDSVSY